MPETVGEAEANDARKSARRWGYNDTTGYHLFAARSGCAMAKMIRCPSGHVYDNDAHESCPECARAGVTEPAPALRTASAAEEDGSQGRGEAKRGIPLTWLIGGGAAAALLIAAAVFMLRPSGSPADPNSDPDFQACLKPSDVQAEACERAIASGKFSGNALSSLYNNRGIGHQKKNDLDGAISDFAEAIKLNGRNAFAYNNRGNAYRNQHKNDEALADFAKAIEIDAKYLSPYNNRGLLYLDQGEFDRAIADFDQVVRLDANYLRAYWNRGSAYLKKGERDHAVADYKKALSLNPDDTTRKMIEAELNQATAQPAPQATATSETPATSSQATPPQQADADSSGTATDDTGKDKGPDPAPNSKVLKSPEEVFADPDFKSCRSMGTNQAADCDRAIASGKFEGPALAVLYNNRGQARGLNHDDDAALEDFNKSIELDPNAAAPHNNRGTIFSERGEYDRAIADFDKAIELNATQPIIFHGRGLAYWRKGDLERATQDYKKALSLNPPPKLKENLEPELKEIEAGARPTPVAEPAQKQGSADTPVDDKNSALSGLREGGSGNASGLPSATEPGSTSQASADQTNDATKAQPPTSGQWAAVAADGSGRWGSAVGQPSQDEARNAALKDCGGSGCKVLDALQASCIAYAESREGGYWYFDWLGPNESAVQNNVLNACNKKAPLGSCKLVKSNCAPGSASRASADPSASQASADPKKDAESCMNTFGGDAMAACDRAIASRHFGKLDLGTLHNQRGVLHLMKLRDDDAIAEFSEAIRLDDSIAQYFNHRGYAYFAKGDYDKAIADFDQAIKRAPESPSGYKGRAQSYFKKGITGLARDDYNKALSLNPDADSRKQIEEALKELGPDVRNMKMQ
jgi:tetratricopeptide (TPR) repeat protein